MRGNDIIPDLRTDPDCRQCRDIRDESVCNHRDSQCRTSEKYPGHPADIKTADLGQHINRVVRIRAVYFNGLFYRVNFSCQSLAGKSCAPAGHSFHRLLEKDRSHGAACCRIPDSHLPGRQNPDTLCRLFRRGLYSGFQCLHRLFPGHRRTLCHIPGSIGNFHVPYAGIPVNADINGKNLCPCLPAQNTGRRLFLKKVFRHLRGNLLSGLRHTLFHHAIVRAHGDQAFLFDINNRCSLNRGDLDDDILQHAQTVKGMSD